jgi:endogenous inhibitor of DNA gyrase (YacG/DUF329 family)
LDDSAVSSPTFVLMHEYADREGRTVLVHVDAYRLKSLEDTESIGWDPVRAEFSDGTVVAIEWADRLSDQFGPNVLTVQLDHRDDQQRLVTMRPTGTWAERMPRLVRCLDQVVDGDAARTKDSEAVYRCPICSGSVRGGAGSFPFCSGRCRTIDLHRWFRGDYRISRPTDHIDPHSSD